MSDQNEIQKLILDAKEVRWLKQKDYLSDYGPTILSFKLNIPYWPKISEEIIFVYDRSLKSFEKFLAEKKLTPKLLSEEQTALGPAAFIHINDHPRKIKEAAIIFEENFEIGRLLDIDVLSKDGLPIERDIKRSCLICDDVSINCMRSNKHTSKEVREVFDKMIELFMK